MLVVSNRGVDILHVFRVSEEEGGQQLSEEV